MWNFLSKSFKSHHKQLTLSIVSIYKTSCFPLFNLFFDKFPVSPFLVLLSVCLTTRMDRPTMKGATKVVIGWLAHNNKKGQQYHTDFLFLHYNLWNHKQLSSIVLLPPSQSSWSFVVTTVSMVYWHWPANIWLHEQCTPCHGSITSCGVGARKVMVIASFGIYLDPPTLNIYSFTIHYSVSTLLINAN